MRIPGEGAGKGDTRRPTDQKKYDQTWIRVFGKDCPMCNGVSEIQLHEGEIVDCQNCNGIGKVEK